MSIIGGKNMKDNTNLIVMLTHNDKTVENAYQIFEQCKNSKANLGDSKKKHFH